MKEDFAKKIEIFSQYDGTLIENKTLAHSSWEERLWFIIHFQNYNYFEQSYHLVMLSRFTLRICMDMGGCDITKFFSALLRRNKFPYQTFNADDRMDSLLMEELKVSFISLCYAI